MSGSVPLKDIIKSFSESILPAYEPQEARSVTFLVLEHVLGITKSDQISNTEIHLSETHESRLQLILRRLIGGEPVQYILGRASFYGRDFKVDKRVLIPRPETEELAHWIIQEQRASGLSLLDVGTGSGCLCVTLALELDNPRVIALDIDKAALQIARENALNMETAISFMDLDILNTIPDMPPVNILVSNPPYVPRSDLSGMEHKVKSHEPHLALLVPDHDALLFYRRLSKIAPVLLLPGGCLYLEIYHTCGPEVCKLFEGPPWKGVILKKDLAGKDRFVKAWRQ